MEAFFKKKKKKKKRGLNLKDPVRKSGKKIGLIEL